MYLEKAERVKSEKSILRKITDFFDSTSNFRMVFLAVMFLDIRYLYYDLYFAVVIAMFVWSVFLIIKHYIIRKKILKVRFRQIIFVFLLSGLFTVILHGERNLFQNLVTLHWLVVSFFLFFGIHAEKSNIRVKREMKRIFDVIIFITTLIMIVGLVLFAIFPNGLKLFGYSFCIYEGRFVGVIPNANVTAFYAVIAIVLSAFMLRMRKADKTRTAKIRIYYICCIAINSFTILLTDSNSTLLFLIVFLSFLFFYELFKEFSEKKLHTLLFRAAASVLSCVLVVSTLLFLRVSVQNGVSSVLLMRQSEMIVSTTLDANDDNIHLDKAEGDLKNTEKEDDQKRMGHQNTNIDSGRFVLWRQALGLIEKFPVFGIGKENISDYGVEYLGGLRYSDLGGYKYIDFHNGLLTITVSFGLVGLSLFMVFAVTVAKSILKAIFNFKERSRRDGNVLLLIAAFSAAYCVYSMFEVALLLDYTYRVCIFWLIIGLGMSYVQKYSQQYRHTGGKLPPLYDDSSEISYLSKKFGIKKREAKHAR